MAEENITRLNGDGRHFRVHPTTDTTGAAIGSGGAWGIWTSEAIGGLAGTGSMSPAQQISFEQLYPAAQALKGQLTRARDLLQMASSHLDAAIESIRSRDLLHADEQIMEFRSLLPELFLCADQYPGMKLIIVAANNGIQNRKGLPLSENQIIEIRYAIAQIRSEPFKSFVDAASLVQKMEHTGLHVSPDAIELFIEEAQAHERGAPVADPPADAARNDDHLR
jgi:hypothetical protein